MSLVEEVCAGIRQNPLFVREYEKLLQQSVLAGTSLSGDGVLNDEALGRLLQSAALFSQSADAEARKLAYRISVGSLSYGNTLGGVENAAKLILARLGNYPAIQFAFGQTGPSAKTPKSLAFEIFGRRKENSISIGGGELILTDLQKNVWDSASGGASMALSAPTSAGKSFVFLAYIAKLKKDNPKVRVVYIVPSRALISQVADDIGKRFAGEDGTVSTVPVYSEPNEGKSPIYVLTPERLQVLLYTAPEVQFDLAIIDEAHLIGDGNRGVILHGVLQALQVRNSTTQYLFSSPQVRDPSVFGSIIGESNIRVVKSKESPVAQNIIFLAGDKEHSQDIGISLWTESGKLPLANIQTKFAVYNSFDRLIYLSWELGHNAQSLVYAEGPASCEDIAGKIGDLLIDPDLNEIPPAISDETVAARLSLSKFAKEAVHASYPLASTVLNGVGFHYGRIPQLLRGAVEASFSNGHLDYIVCTSTLLQGVNLPARNIFMQNPHRGEETPIDPVNFWNLAGRAGRLGKDFQGNVYLVDYDEWESAPLAGPKDEVIKPSLEVMLTADAPRLLEYMRSTDRPAGEQHDYEAAFSKLFRDHRRGDLAKTLDDLPAISVETRELVEAALRSADASIELSTDTLEASPQVSAFRQQQLYDYMVDKIGGKGPDYLIPLHPSGSWKAVLDKLRPVFARVHKYLELKSGNHHRYWAPLALRWMRGDPLPMLIGDAIAYHKKQGKRRADPTVIREVLTDVESGLRFRYVNLMSCYCAVLKQALTNRGFESHVKKIPALTLYLELGAASQTMIQFMGMGLSRHTASALAEKTANKDMDGPSAIRFLRRMDLSASDLSPYVTSEIRRAIR